LAEFCECGSLVIDSRCSNKNCSLKGNAKPVPARKSTRAKAAVKITDDAKPSVKASNPRRASKMITYNLYEVQENEPES